MKFPRSKKLIFVNNKGGVGKTILLIEDDTTLLTILETELVKGK